MKWFKSLNTPNKLTLTRMLCVVLIIIFTTLDILIGDKMTAFNLIGKTKQVSNDFFITPYITYSWNRLIILILFIFGSITDFLDGHIARKNNIVTTFGKFLDPIADKLLVNITAFFAYITFANGKFVIIPIIYIFRDTIVDGIRLIAAQKNIVIAASLFGKAKTTSQMISIILLIAFTPIADFKDFMWLTIILAILGIISALISIASGIEYLIKNKKVIFED